jgi:hypothetical protein
MRSTYEEKVKKNTNIAVPINVPHGGMEIEVPHS